MINRVAAQISMLSRRNLIPTNIRNLFVSFALIGAYRYASSFVKSYTITSKKEGSKLRMQSIFQTTEHFRLWKTFFWYQSKHTTEGEDKCIGVIMSLYSSIFVLGYLVAQTSRRLNNWVWKRLFGKKFWQQYLSASKRWRHTDLAFKFRRWNVGGKIFCAKTS